MSVAAAEAVADYIDSASRLLDVPVDAAYRAGVIAHFTVIQGLAEQVLALPLPDDAAAAAVFAP